MGYLGTRSICQNNQISQPEDGAHSSTQADVRSRPSIINAQDPGTDFPGYHHE